MGENKQGRPLMAAVAAQQKVISKQARENRALRDGLKMVCAYAGLTDKLGEILKAADIMNPASPVADPPEAPPSETTEQAATPSASDNVENIGLVPNSTTGVPAAATTTVMTPGADIDTAPFSNLQDVTAPVTGTPTHIPEDQTRIEVDVRVGDPDDPTKNFALIPEFANEPSTGANDPDMRAKSSRTRTLQALKLARLRLTAGIAQGDELELCGQLEAQAALTDEMMAHEIAVLSSVHKAAARRSDNPRNLVPRTAGVQRTVPSLSPDAPAAPQGLASRAALAGNDTLDADLFLDF